MAFCTNCGTPLDDGSMFCAHCGAKVGESCEIAARETPFQTEQPQPLSEQLSASANQGAIDEGAVLMEYPINSNSFHVVDDGGKTLSTVDVFEKTFTAAAIAVAVISVGAGLTATQWFIKVQLYKNKICFTKLNMLGRPTKNQVVLDGKEMTAVTKTNTFTIMNKNEITVNTYSRGAFVFEASRKNRDTVVYLLQEMINRNIN